MPEAVLRIDADTARLISKMAEVAQKGEGMTKSVAKLGDGFDEIAKSVEGVGGSLTKTLGVVGLVTGAVSLGREAFLEWERSLERSAALAKNLQATLPGAQGGNLGGLGAARSRILALDSPLTAEQRGSAYQAYRRAAPTATDDEAIAAVRQAGDASIAGIDANEFAGNMGRLRFMGDRAPDAATYISQRAGGQSSDVVDLLAEIAAKLGSDQANGALPLAVGAARTPGGLAVLRQGLGAFVDQGRQGPFADTFLNQGLSLVPGLGTRQVLNNITATIPGEVGQSVDGRLAGSISAARGDFNSLALDITARGTNRTTIDEYQRRIGSAALDQADTNLSTAYGRQLGPLAPRLLPQIAGRFGLLKNYYDPLVSQAQEDVSTIQQALRTNELLEEQNAEIARQRRPSLTVHGEP